MSVVVLVRRELQCSAVGRASETVAGSQTGAG